MAFESSAMASESSKFSDPSKSSNSKTAQSSATVSTSNRISKLSTSALLEQIASFKAKQETLKAQLNNPAWRIAYTVRHDVTQRDLRRAIAQFREEVRSLVAMRASTEVFNYAIQFQQSQLDEASRRYWDAYVEAWEKTEAYNRYQLEIREREAVVAGREKEGAQMDHDGEGEEKFDWAAWDEEYKPMFYDRMFVDPPGAK